MSGTSGPDAPLPEGPGSWQEARAAERGLENLVSIEAAPHDPRLPSGSWLISLRYISYDSGARLRSTCSSRSSAASAAASAAWPWSATTSNWPRTSGSC